MLGHSVVWLQGNFHLVVSGFSCLHPFLPFDVVAPEDKGTGTRPLVTQLVLVSDPEASVLLLNGASCPHTPAPGGVCLQSWPPPRLPVMVNSSLQMASVWMKEPLSSSVPAGRLPSLPALPVSPNSWQRSVGSEASLFICLGGLPAHF